MRGGIVRFSKVAQTNADEPVPLLGAKIYPLAQFQGDVNQFVTGTKRRVFCMTARENLELTGLQLEYHRAGSACFLARG